MRAWEIQNPAGLEALALVEKPDPQPQPGQVLLKMRAVSLNYRDLLMVKGAYGSAQPLPLVPLSDGVGEVVAVGDGVTQVQVGDRVAGIFMQRWQAGAFSADYSRSALGGAIAGLLAEYVVLPEFGVIQVPDHLSDQEAATLPCAAVTAWHALITAGKLKAGETVLTLGSGGVSLFALQFAHLVGARVIATSSSDEKLEKLRQLGAAAGINYKTNPDWEKTVWQLTDKVGVDHVVEVGGAGTLNRSLRSVRAGGQISLIGVLSGTQADINTAAILMRNIRIQGIYVGSKEMFAAMNRAIALHHLHPIVDRVFPFEAAPAAFEYLQSGAHFGKIIIRF